MGRPKLGRPFLFWGALSQERRDVPRFARDDGFSFLKC